MTVFELARLRRVALIAAYLDTRPNAWHDRTWNAHEFIPAMSREQLVAGILNQRQRGKR